MEDDELEPRFTTRIRFRLGEVLPADEPLAQWIANLSRALNDLLLARRRLKRGFADDTPAYEHFYDIRAIDALYGDAGSGAEFRNRLGSARDQATHYSRIDHKLVRSSLARLRDLDAEILVDRRWGDFRAEFAATLDAQLFFAIEDDTGPFERFSEELNELSGRLIQFARVAIDHYLLARDELLAFEPI